MKWRVLSALMALAITSGVAAPVSVHASAAGAPAAPEAREETVRDLAKAQVEFGIRVAQKKLWREATYRFEKAVEVDPTYAAAWNNLAIAYEEQGKFPDADKAYQRAVQLEPENVLIRQNYDLFKEIYDRIQARSRRR
jgi:Tfp pilus assembly protein PilF